MQDATITAPAFGEILQYDGSTWINAPAPNPITNLDDLGDVILPTPANGDVLTYSGSEWIAVPGGGAGGGGIIDPTISKGDIVVRNASTVGRLPIGDDGDVLVADSSAATGLRWAANAPVAARLYRTTTLSVPSAAPTRVSFSGLHVAAIKRHLHLCLDDEVKAIPGAEILQAIRRCLGHGSMRLVKAALGAVADLVKHTEEDLTGARLIDLPGEGCVYHLFHRLQEAGVVYPCRDIKSIVGLAGSQ